MESHSHTGGHYKAIVPILLSIKDIHGNIKQPNIDLSFLTKYNLPVDYVRNDPYDLSKAIEHGKFVGHIRATTDKRGRSLVLLFDTTPEFHTINDYIARLVFLKFSYFHNSLYIRFKENAHLYKEETSPHFSAATIYHDRLSSYLDALFLYDNLPDKR